MLGRFKRKRTLRIISEANDSTLYPGDKYVLNVNVDFSRNGTSVFVKAPITFSWDGERLIKIDGP